MVIQIKKPVTKDKIDAALKSFKLKQGGSKKGDLSKFFGISKTGINPLSIQKKMRDDWS